MRGANPSDLARLLEQRGMSVCTLLPSPAQAVPTLLTQFLAATRGETPRLVVAGGDGTINSLLPIFSLPQGREDGDRDLTLAILPLGSVNVLARELGLPLRLKQAVVVAAEGRARPIDLGLCHNKPFVLMAGFGFDGAVVHAVSSAEKRRLGPLSYLLHALRLFLRYRPHSFAITCDGRHRQVLAWLVIVTNAVSYSYHWRLAPQARIDDGLLEVCIFPDRGLLRRIRQVIGVLLSRPHWGGVEYLSGRRIEITPDPPAPVQIDGEPASVVSSATIEVLPRALKVIVPAQQGLEFD